MTLAKLIAVLREVRDSAEADTQTWSRPLRSARVAQLPELARRYVSTLDRVRHAQAALEWAASPHLDVGDLDLPTARLLLHVVFKHLAP